MAMDLERLHARMRQRNRAHDAARAGVSLAHFPNSRREYVADCRDCRAMLFKGEGTRQERNGRLRMVCRDREACERRQRAWGRLAHALSDEGALAPHREEM